MKKFWSRLKKYQIAIWVILFLGLWEASSRLGWVNTYLLPPFSAVAKQGWSEIAKGILPQQIANSLLLVVEGFSISFGLAIIISGLCIASKVVESLFRALCTFMNPLPGIAILPLIMMWFGIDQKAMLALIIHGVMWPLITNLIEGFRSVPKVYIEWGKNIGLSPFRMLTDIYFGAVISYVIAGLRVGWGRAWRALISAEMIFGIAGGVGGLGYYIYQNRAYANTANVLVGVVVIIIIGVVIDQGIFNTVERLTIKKWGSIR